MTWYISLLCSKKSRAGEALSELADLGYTHVQMTGGTVYYDGMLEDVERVRSARGLTLSVHNYFPPQQEEFVLDTASDDAREQARCKTMITQAVELASRWGCRAYGVHPGYLRGALPVLKDNYFVSRPGSPRTMRGFYETISSLSEVCAASGVRLLVENLAPRAKEDPYSFVTSREDIGEFLSFCGKTDNLGILVDLAHLGVAAEVFGFERDEAVECLFGRYAHLIGEVHVSHHEGACDAHGVLREDSWQIEALRRYRGSLGNTPVVCEWHGCADAKTRARFDEMISFVG